MPVAANLIRKKRKDFDDSDNWTAYQLLGFKTNFISLPVSQRGRK